MSSAKSQSLSVYSHENGYVLLSAIFLTFLFLLMLSVAAPRMAVELQRDKEQETIHRGQQYARAIEMYYKTFGKYPATLDDLDQGGRYRFLRKRYTDPLTGKNDWRLIHLGEATVPILGFFGQPIAVPPPQAVSANAAQAPPGGLVDAAASDAASLGAQSFSSPGSTSDAEGAAGNLSGANPAASPNNGPVTDGNGIFGPNGSIVGVALPMKKPSLLAWRRQESYNRWEFVYDPLQDRMTAASIPGGSFPGNAAEPTPSPNEESAQGSESTSDSPVVLTQTVDTQ